MGRSYEIDVDDDADTSVIELSQGSFVGEPPPLPVRLLRRRIKIEDDDRWVQALPAQVRAVLEAARRPAARWPFGDRVDGAVATPLPVPLSED